MSKHDTPPYSARVTAAWRSSFFSTWISSKTSFDVSLWSQCRISFSVVLGVTHSLWVPTRIPWHFYIYIYFFFIILCAVRRETPLLPAPLGVAVITLRTPRLFQSCCSSPTKVKSSPVYRNTEVPPAKSKHSWSGWGQQLHLTVWEEVTCWEAPHWGSLPLKPRHSKRRRHVKGNNERSPVFQRTHFICICHSLRPHNCI